jgi:hypothetical protein
MCGSVASHLSNRSQGGSTGRTLASPTALAQVRCTVAAVEVLYF